ncbi:UDP-N-acetylglucosamine 2-epimerase (non-hydrolysing) [Desulfacinum hydrothermale DSM 13146]|uniref:UDP-N-acetylglucosamine 2-epimerase (Non-hydrolysing) n=1 Tax=Desulfacinum hydrothermale DSM 13146 TaxID=1121390 RepID=A0A1W1XRC0_9BACT|nr:UDP-N-acetylglucosamine 2-epimerase (non-hydrolyzing) [Desulfacinum hydrothermale]SMC26402.1 UDP-N-acetylglucosamine 2-epimerase (non-hydrolysing) [Desulfacinum hydrothermale DSM 13146]
MKLFVVAGARPNFMKVAPFLHAIARHNQRCVAGNGALEPLLVHTGQHYDIMMSEVFFRELNIPTPDVNLEVGSGTHARQTAAVMVRFEEVCHRDRPHWVIVVGDVNSTMACTLVAAKLGISVAHVEAGLRSFDRTMPEEINRLVTDALADLLLTPSADADENLAREGVPREKIHRVGNIMIDCLVANLARARARRAPVRLGVEPGRYAYVTLHRPSNVDCRESLEAILENLVRLSRDLPVIFPVHPRTHKALEAFGLDHVGAPGLHKIAPVGYQDSLCLTENARLVLTDSGGLQEESTYFRTPCLTLRPNTERPVTVTEGSNRLTSLEALAGDIQAVLNGPERLGRVPDLWDGRTAERIVQVLLKNGTP